MPLFNPTLFTYQRIHFIKFALLVDIDGHGLEFITLFLDKNGSLCFTPFSLVFGLFFYPSSLYVILLKSPAYLVKYPLLGLKLTSCFTITDVCCLSLFGYFA